MEEARKAILKANGGRPPRVLDPFAGGGSIPLEALRLGCETYASDYNPVATFILKCTLEYPQKYDGRLTKRESNLDSDKSENRLLDDVRKWSTWVLNEAADDVQRFYPEEKDGSVPVGFIWARTVACQNPSCGAIIPLIRQFWLARKRDRKISLFPYTSQKEINFKIVGTGYEKMPNGFDPERGTVSGAIASCLICGSVIEGKSIQRISFGGKSGQRLLAVILHKEGSSGKKYRIANEMDVKTFERAEASLLAKRNVLSSEWGLDPVPDEPIHTPDNKEYQPGNLLYNFTPVMLYGLTRWGDVFNERQKLALITFAEKVRQAWHNIIADGTDEEYARAVCSYLSVIVDRLADKSASLVVYNVYGEKIEHVFGRQALPFAWDYVEVNPFTDVGWPNMQEWVERVISHCSQLSSSAKVTQSSATSLSYPDDFFDAVFTDPPYYDNVPYADLSDFFYVWLKRTIGNQYPELFSTPLTPKSDEIIAELPLLRGMSKSDASQIVTGIKTSEHFEKMLGQAFREIRRVLKQNGICVLVYAHKSTAGWETLINSLLNSGLVVTAAWPIHTEIRSGLRVSERAVLASSIYMVTRKLDRKPVGFYKDMRDALESHLTGKLDTLWNEGVSGGDFFISAIGSAIEVFGKYERILDDEGSIVRADRLLEEIRKVSTSYAIKKVLHDGISGQITALTRFYVLFRWAYAEALIEFDDAHKLAQGVGISLDREWHRGFIRKNKEFVQVLGPEDRELGELEGSNELIDTLHRALLLWEMGRSDQVLKTLKDTGFGSSDVFYRVAQAIAESLPSSSREKKLLEGFLQGRQRISEDIRKQSEQTKLIE